jgi:hypothetical protein
MWKVICLALLATVVFAWAPGCTAADSRGGDDDSGGDSDSDSDSDTDGLNCDPGEVWCYQGWVSECNEDGDGWDLIEECEEPLVCAAGECQDISQQCADAINEKSYIGCEYYGVTLANGVLSDNFGYAVAVANHGGTDANVHVTDGAAISNDYTVPGGEMIVIEDLPWNLDLKEPGTFAMADWATRKVSNGTYHITSDRPVTAYQFSALHYTDGIAFSYTNDASLLLPSHIYLDEYIVMSRPTLKVEDSFSQLGNDPGLFAIVGDVEEPITVEITLAGYTVASDSTSNENYSAMSPGEHIETTIQPFEVLQVLTQSESGCTGSQPCGGSIYFCCDTPDAYDLTGTVIRVLEGPNPAVFGGTECSFVPWNKWACDHLEQQMFPVETWGQRYLCAHNITQAPGEPTVWRVMSGSQSNEISFNPSSVHPNVTLNKGDYVEFESQADFEVQGTGRVSVAGFMVGQNYTSDTAPPPRGDPAMSMAVPVEQYRTDYTFLAPTSYEVNYLTVIHEIGAYPSLDGTSLSGWGTTMDITNTHAKTELEIEGGIHYIDSDTPFAIMVYGVGSYTSYMYPGGLDLGKVDIGVE